MELRRAVFGGRVEGSRPLMRFFWAFGPVTVLRKMGSFLVVCYTSTHNSLMPGNIAKRIKQVRTPKLFNTQFASSSFWGLHLVQLLFHVPTSQDIEPR